MRRNLKPLLLAIFGFCCQSKCFSQAIRVDVNTVNDRHGGYSVHWDPVHEKLILFRDIDSSGVPAARMYSQDGTSIAVYPMQDIEGSWYVNVWDAAAKPDGGLVLASVVGYTAPGATPDDARSALLIYDASGHLTSFWAVKPYMHENLAVDQVGNIFALGMNYGEEPYPLVVKYSPSGNVLKEFFSTALLAKGEKGTVPGPADGQNEMFIDKDGLVVWIAASQELFRFSLNGDLVSRNQFQDTLGRFATSVSAESYKVEHLAPDENGDFIFQVALYGQQASFRSVRVALVRVAKDASNAALLNSVESSAKLLWARKGGKALYLQYDPVLKATTVVER